MFNRKNSNLLFLPMPKPIKDSTPDYTEIRTARNQSLEKQLRKIKQKIPPIQTDRHYSSTQDLLEKVQEQVLYKTSILSRKSSNATILPQPKKIEQNQQQQQQLQDRRNEIDFVLKKLLNAQAIINDEPQQMIEPRIYNPYFRSPSVLPSHLKDTYFDPDKYQNFYDKLSKNNLKVNHQVRAAILNYRKQISSKQQRVPNFLKLVQ
ncbi:unnamed protein product (macronuclear) [Paramecium tetraurelia]|uniref:Uncharacterized protein n=1 Tax=Paramecium tetraurelia TaxID=5888 RepID=A0EHK3_PARTE|nr:uncharacterized protein GSPATT00027118001 [Paramecium tetraurelia]CAK94794.1 unnamed protein product [Paramecium tetraurelia]|eukprot:XP_001462167.1 hypothetical protein (macronuclear) [Paramecium tetraurelia strain d4-2]